MIMKNKAIIKTMLCLAVTVMSIGIFGLNVFSVIDFSAGESGLINNEMTPHTVNITADGQNVAVVPVGIGIRGDADGNNTVGIYDAIEISKYLVGTAKEGFEDSFGFIMSDTNINGSVDLYDAVNIAKYLLIEGTHEEKWAKILG